MERSISLRQNNLSKIMDGVQKIDLDSARLVLVFLMANAAIVDADDELKKLRDFLLVTIPKVDAAGGIQLAGRGGVKNFKDNLKIDGSVIAKKWLNALKTVPAPLDMELPGIVERSPSVYEKLDDNSWYQFNLKLIAKCTQYEASVAKYGRTQLEIDELTQKNDAFLTAMTKPEEVTNMLAKSTKNLGDGIDGINSLARDTDKFVKAYGDVHPEFVEGYFESRRKKG